MPQGPSPEPATEEVPPTVARFLSALASLQARRPSILLLLCAALTALGLWRASKLELKTRFEQLLPDSQASVVELHRVVERTSGISNVFVVLEGDDVTVLRGLGDAIVPRLRAIGAPYVGSAEDGVQAARGYLMPRAAFFAELGKLQKLREDVDARWDYEVSKGMGTELEEREPPPPITAERIKEAFGDRKSDEDRYPDGYYQSKDGRTLVVVARAAIAAGDLEGQRETLRRVRAVVDEARAAPAFAAVRVGYAGDLVTGLFEYGAIKDDLVSVGTLGVGLVLLVIFLFYMRVRTLVALGLTIAAGCAWTFGITQLTIGHLNVATGFLVSIVAGNGINFGIIYQARYLEERRGGASVAVALDTAYRTTWIATLTAALAAGASYGSLAITDFRGFKHFALIGAVGMLCCWVATYTLLPATLSLIERVRPFTFGAARRGIFGALRFEGLRFDAPFSFLVPRAPRILAVTGVALAFAGLAAAVVYVRSDPMEYDMRKLQNDLGNAAELYRVSALARDVLGVNTESGMVILCDTLDEVAPLKRELEKRRDAAPPSAKPFEAVHTLLDFVPERQAEKLPQVTALRDRLVRSHEKKLITEKDWAELSPYLPSGKVASFGIADLPEDLARSFTEKDGTRGRLVFIEPTAGKNDNDLHYLLAWADSFRETKLPNGETIRGSGRAVIFADMLRAVVTDMPRAIVASLAMTALVVLLVFRRGRQTAVVLGALAIGVLWLAGLLALLKVRLNFLNFVALPITFGIGVDYAVNLVQRYGDGREGVLAALRTTGGAVVLCSLTTILGYLALLGSLNQAVRGLGLVAVLGEVCCLSAALLVLPAALLWRERRAGGPRAPL